MPESMLITWFVTKRRDDWATLYNFDEPKRGMVDMTGSEGSDLATRHLDSTVDGHCCRGGR